MPQAIPDAPGRITAGHGYGGERGEQKEDGYQWLAPWSKGIKAKLMSHDRVQFVSVFVAYGGDPHEFGAWIGKS